MNAEAGFWVRSEKEEEEESEGEIEDDDKVLGFFMGGCSFLFIGGGDEVDGRWWIFGV